MKKTRNKNSTVCELCSRRRESAARGGKREREKHFSFVTAPLLRERGRRKGIRKLIQTVEKDDSWRRGEKGRGPPRSQPGTGGFKRLGKTSIDALFKGTTRQFLKKDQKGRKKRQKGRKILAVLIYSEIKCLGRGGGL